MTKIKKVSKRKRVVTIKLNSFVFNKLVLEIVDKVYGTTPYGQRFWFHDTALESLQEAAERFLENMWDHLRELSDNNVVTVDHIHLWKRQTNFKPRFKSNSLSLCKIFKKQL